MLFSYNFAILGGKRLLVYVQVVIEKENGILSLLRVSGMQSAAYWLATLLSDLMLFFGVVSLILGMGLSFGQPPFIKVSTNCFMNLVEIFWNVSYTEISAQLRMPPFNMHLSELGFSYSSS